MERLMRNVMRSEHARALRVRQTPRVMYLQWQRPQRVGVVRVGDVTVTDKGEAYYGSQGRIFRCISQQDLEKLEHLEEELHALQHKRQQMLKRVWKQSRELEPDELTQMGAETWEDEKR